MSREMVVVGGVQAVDLLEGLPAGSDPVPGAEEGFGAWPRWSSMAAL